MVESGQLEKLAPMPMLKVLQANLNHCRAAQDLLSKYMEEESIDVAIISDPYKICDNGCSMLTDTGSRRAAILVPGNQVSVANIVRDSEFVSARVGGYQIYSCYATPNPATREEFNNLLSRLESSVRSIPRGNPVVVAGDFNARSAAWGDRVTTLRGDELGDLFASLQLDVQNVGSSPTFTGGGGSIVDITATSSRVSCTSWRVLSDTFNYSDHDYVRFELGNFTRTRHSSISTSSFRGWDTSKGLGLLEVGLLIADWLNPAADNRGRDAAHTAKLLEDHVSAACNFALPRKPVLASPRKPVHWWNSELSTLRKICTAAKRKKTRLSTRAKRIQATGFDQDILQAAIEMADEAATQLRAAKKSIKVAIIRSKESCWNELIRSVDEDPFGKPYKAVLRKLSGPPAATRMELGFLKSTILSLFPSCPPIAPSSGHLPAPIIPFSDEEINNTVKRFRSRNTAPGPDHITNRIIAEVHKINPAMLKDTFTKCLTEGAVPARWKEARVVLLRKGNKPLNVPSSYRPLCLLNDLGKMFESLVAVRLNTHITNKGGLAHNQFGFRKGRSTDDAVRKLREKAVGAMDKGRYCVAVALDIKNAFNSVEWKHILTALESWEVPEYLMRICISYFSNRKAFIESPHAPNGVLDVQITGGVPQGSVIGPLLWNLTYDSVLKTVLPAGAEIIGFADDTLVIVEGKETGELESTANAALGLVAGKISNLGLSIAVEKTQAVLFTYKYKYTRPNLVINNFVVACSDEMLYLGILVDKFCLFKAHMRKVANKAEGISAQLSRLMPNLGGPREKRRRLLVAVVHSVLLYGAPSWAGTLEFIPENVRQLNKSQRKVLLRSICGYRTVSEVAVGVLSSTPPADLLAIEREAMFLRKRRAGDSTGVRPGVTSATEEAALRVALRRNTLIKWCQRLEEADKGAWTRELIRDVPAWCRRSYGFTTFHLTQLFSGHGCFGQYLHRIGKERSSLCHHCGADLDDARHTMFVCSSWAIERDEVRRVLGNFEITSLTEKMMSHQECWDAVVRFAERVMLKKEDHERARRGEIPRDGEAN